MKEVPELLKVANALSKLMEKKDKDIIKTYKNCIKTEKFNEARIISDELVDYFDEKGDDKRTEKAKILYDKTMGLFELIY